MGHPAGDATGCRQRSFPPQPTMEEHDGRNQSKHTRRYESKGAPMSPAQIVKEWWLDSTAKRLALVGTAVSAIAASIIAIMNVGQVMEPTWIATRGFVRELLQTSEQNTGSRLLSLEIASKESQRDNVQSKLDSLDLELRKNADAPDSLKAILNEQVRRYSEQLRLLNYELDDLRRKQAGRRP